MAHCLRAAFFVLLLLQLKSKGYAAYFSSAGPELVVEGSPKDFICKSDYNEPIYDCIFTVPGFLTKIKIYSGVHNEKYEFVGDGFSKGQCGLKLLSVNRSNSGSVGCSIDIGDMMTQEAAIDLTVLFPIDDLKVVSNSKDGLYEYKENETMEFKCTAEGGYPAPTNLSLFIGGTMVKSTSEQRVLSWKEVAGLDNDDQLVLCSAEQSHFSTPPVHEIRKLTIFYSPRPKDELYEVERQVVIGERTDITLNILANKPPQKYELTKNGEAQASNLYEVKNGTITEYTWTIMKVSEGDVGEWKFFVENGYGSTIIAIKLKQATDLGAVAILGIIIAAFVTVLIVAVLGSIVCKYARAGRFSRSPIFLRAS